MKRKSGCGTAWLWASDKSRRCSTTLFVDEAGQMSLAYVLAASRSASNLILLGDPQQLEQPQRGAHPEGSEVAALPLYWKVMKRCLAEEDYSST